MNRRVQAHVRSLLLFTLLALGACSSQKAGSANRRISATVSGLLGSGLVIQTNGGNSVTVTADGPVLLAYISSGAHYDVTINEQPHEPVQSCTVTGGSGTVGDSDISDISIACTGGAFDVIARVSGLIGTGLVLRDDVSGRSVSVTANGPVALDSQITDGSSFAVEVANPTNPVQTCSVSPAGGRLAGANAVVDVTCSTHTFDITASVFGLLGQGLALQANVSGGGPLTVAANGTVTLASQVADGSPYSVTVTTQPTTPSQICTVLPATGKLDGANATVAVTCATAYRLGGTISGYAGSELTLSAVGLQDLTVPAGSTTFSFATGLLSGSNYSVTVKSQPVGPWQTCSVVNGTGVVSGADVTSVAVSCVTKKNKSGILSAGGLNSVALRTDGSLWAWGWNLLGQLGDGTTTNKSSPERIGTSTWAYIASGWYHTLAVKTDGTLWTWGANNYGQLGDGTTIDKSSPEQIGTDTHWASVAGGYYFSVAIKTDGTLWAWGPNDCGQLGDGTTTSRTTPVQIGTDTNWVSVSAGYFHTIALKSDGSLWAWGLNNYGQLGDGTMTNLTAHTSPERIGTDTNWAQIANGFYASLAIKSDGTLWAWGQNISGELGDGTYTNRSSPEQIGTDTHWAFVDGGSDHTVAVKTDGTLWAWGYNHYGQLGDGTTNSRNSPEQIGTDTHWSLVAGGDEHSLALKTDGSAWAWGQNSDGQLGDSTTTSRLSPVQAW